MSPRRKPGGAASPALQALTGLVSVQEEIRDGLEEACRDAAQRVLVRMWENDVVELCGERWRPRRGAQMARAGACRCEITLAGQRVRVRRPRVRSRDGREIELATYRFVCARDVLDAEAIAAITAQVCLGSAPASRDAPRRRFLDQVARELRGALSEPHRDPGAVLILGEALFREHTVLVALGLGAQRARHLLALQSGGSDNTGAVAALLRDASRGRATRPPVLLAVGEHAPLEAAARRHFGSSVPVYRCPIEKRRRVVGLLPAGSQAGALEALRAAYGIEGEARARRALQSLARAWARPHPRAAEALRDGLAESLALHRLGVFSPGRRARERARPRPRP